MAQQKVVLKVMTMSDDKTKQKAMEAAADIYGVDSIAADMKEQKLTVIGVMDTVAVCTLRVPTDLDMFSIRIDYVKELVFIVLETGHGSGQFLAAAAAT
ncbi:hypothetical protein CK203_107537 [Vitis vinifera]|uniref:HMA domain-containing protein n=1 Tax=Vitis vinifera TaxID=29760 RepID=A0A438CWV2_VITVI|nr:hypothetical protein CK203_107537 [Vitis vinifera]